MEVVTKFHQTIGTLEPSETIIIIGNLEPTRIPSWWFLFTSNIFRQPISSDNRQEHQTGGRQCLERILPQPSCSCTMWFRTRRIKVLIQRLSAAQIVGINLQSAPVAEFAGGDSDSDSDSSNGGASGSGGLLDSTPAEEDAAPATSIIGPTIEYFPVVGEVVADSAAFRSGIRPHDRLCKIGEKIVLHRGHDIDGIVEVIRALPASFNIEVLRGMGPIDDGGLGSIAWEEEQRQAARPRTPEPDSDDDDDNDDDDDSAAAASADAPQSPQEPREKRSSLDTGKEQSTRKKVRCSEQLPSCSSSSSSSSSSSTSSSSSRPPQRRVAQLQELANILVHDDEIIAPIASATQSRPQSGGQSRSTSTSTTTSSRSQISRAAKKPKKTLHRAPATSTSTSTRTSTSTSTVPQSTAPGTRCGSGTPRTRRPRPSGGQEGGRGLQAPRGLRVRFDCDEAVTSCSAPTTNALKSAQAAPPQTHAP